MHGTKETGLLPGEKQINCYMCNDTSKPNAARSHSNFSQEPPHLLHQVVQIPISNLAVLSVGKAHHMRLQIHVGEEEGLVHE